MQPESMETEFTAPFSLCKAATHSTHLGNYSPLFPNFTFYCQTSPCFFPAASAEQIQISSLLFFLLFVFPNQMSGVFSSEIDLVQD